MAVVILWPQIMIDKRMIINFFYIVALWLFANHFLSFIKLLNHHHSLSVFIKQCSHWSYKILFKFISWFNKLPHFMQILHVHIVFMKCWMKGKVQVLNIKLKSIQEPHQSKLWFILIYLHKNVCIEKLFSTSFLLTQPIYV